MKLINIQKTLMPALVIVRIAELESGITSGIEELKGMLT